MPPHTPSYSYENVRVKFHTHLPSHIKQGNPLPWPIIVEYDFRDEPAPQAHEVHTTLSFYRLNVQEPVKAIGAFMHSYIAGDKRHILSQFNPKLEAPGEYEIMARGVVNFVNPQGNRLQKSLGYRRDHEQWRGIVSENPDLEKTRMARETVEHLRENMGFLNLTEREIDEWANAGI
ncbi:hypothetical protein FQN53_003094 [Emmonsiellopsis sp. PD_33]|nr:hypothetical protein FQN53_003094 [Emmonsiellopsis sp. PD_33]